MVQTAQRISIETLLDALVEACQPTREQHARAMTSYGHVGDWLCAPDGSLARFDPRYSPQGSFAYGTVVRPLWQHEFDVDGLARLMVDPFRMSSDDAFNRVAGRLREHGDLAKRMELHARCIRLHYQGHFHHDVTPACDDPRPGRGMLIRAKPEERRDDSPWSSWKVNDSFGFACWLDDRDSRLVKFARAAGVDPEPPYVPASRKTPLRKIVQLAKMRRNRYYKPDSIPSSMLITAMAGYCYDGQGFTLDAIIEVVGRMWLWAEEQGDQLQVFHPTLPDEDLAKCLDVAGKRRFRKFLATYHAELLALRDKRGIHVIGEDLGEMFDRVTTRSALESVAASVQSARADRQLHVGRTAAPLIIVADKATGRDVLPKPIPDHKFFGGPIGQ